MPTVRCGVENHIIRAPLNPAIKRRFQRFVCAFAMFKGQIIGKDNETPVNLGEKPHQEGQILDILAVNFDQPAIQTLGAQSAMHGFDKR